jgi:tetratricopeptide (TPR) repeat protein
MALADLSSLSNEAILEQAETAFRDGLNAHGTPEEPRFFRQASELYEELRQRGVENSDLYRNQGNASLLTGNLAEAILAYQRGLQLAPNDRELRANLAYIRDQVIYPSPGNFARPPVTFLPIWLPRLTPGLLLVLTFLFYTVSCLGIARWGMTRQKLPLQGAVWALGLGILFGIGLVIQSRGIREEAKYPLVVIARDGTYLRKGNHSDYPRSYDIPLNQGVEARSLYVRGDWLQIELAGGEAGWVPGKSVLVDTP